MALCVLWGMRERWTEMAYTDPIRIRSAAKKPKEYTAPKILWICTLWWTGYHVDVPEQKKGRIVHEECKGCEEKEKGLCTGPSKYLRK
jgi:hypothetical protein